MAKSSITTATIPYIFNIKSNKELYADLIKALLRISNMYNYAQANIPAWNTMTSIPEEHLPSNINTSTATNWYGSFNGCTNLTSLPNPFYDMSNSIDARYMFHNCINVKDFSMINFGNNTTTLYGAFNNCTNLINAPIIPNSVTDIGYAFKSCTNLINPPNIPNNIKSMYWAFHHCTNLINAPVIPNSVTDMSSTFYYCSNLVNTPVIPNSVTTMSSTFAHCTNLQGDIYIYSNNITSATNCFCNCTNYAKNIYVYENTNTYNAFYNAMGNATYNANWNAYLKTIDTTLDSIFIISGDVSSDNTYTGYYDNTKLESLGLDDNMTMEDIGSMISTNSLSNSIFGFIFDSANYLGLYIAIDACPIDLTDKSISLEILSAETGETSFILGLDSNIIMNGYYYISGEIYVVWDALVDAAGSNQIPIRLVVS